MASKHLDDSSLPPFHDPLSFSCFHPSSRLLPPFPFPLSWIVQQQVAADQNNLSCFNKLTNQLGGFEPTKDSGGWHTNLVIPTVTTILFKFAAVDAINLMVVVVVGVVDRRHKTSLTHGPTDEPEEPASDALNAFGTKIGDDEIRSYGRATGLSHRVHFLLLHHHFWVLFVWSTNLSGCFCWRFLKMQDLRCKIWFLWKLEINQTSWNLEWKPSAAAAAEAAAAATTEWSKKMAIQDNSNAVKFNENAITQSNLKSTAFPSCGGLPSPGGSFVDQFLAAVCARACSPNFPSPCLLILSSSGSDDKKPVLTAGLPGCRDKTVKPKVDHECVRPAFGETSLSLLVGPLSLSLFPAVHDDLQTETTVTKKGKNKHTKSNVQLDNQS